MKEKIEGERQVSQNKVKREKTKAKAIAVGKRVSTYY